MAPSTARAVDEYRYERKFLISDLTKYEVESLVRLHPAMFSQVYPPRFVNSVYFDSVDMTSYLDAVDGTADRMKIRIRWYGDLWGTVDQPVLELKIKRALVGTKRSYRLGSLSLEGQCDLGGLTRIVADSDVPQDVTLRMLGMRAMLVSRYYRRYYLSADRTFRITVDTEMELYDVNACGTSCQPRDIDDVSTVLELKYDCDNDERADGITNHFPFRMTKNSKYANGVMILAY